MIKSEKFGFIVDDAAFIGKRIVNNYGNSRAVGFFLTDFFFVELHSCPIHLCLYKWDKSFLFWG